MPKPLSGKILQLEIRVTPYDQEPIVIDESDLQMFEQLVLCEEGSPNGVPKLHYHGYVETRKSESWLRSFLKKISHAPDNEKVNGNALYFTRKPHEHTTGYIVKSGNVICRHGIPQTTIDEWIATSSKYQKDKATDRKRKQRSRDDELAHVIADVESYLKDNETVRSEHDIIARILAVCHADNIRFPTRSQMEYFVNKLLYPYRPDTVRLYYAKSFQVFRT